MNSIINIIENMTNSSGTNPTSEADINEAEKRLGTSFADEYIAYTAKYGAVFVNGIELTGVVKSNRLNVVHVTLEERARDSSFPRDMYVIENVGIDGILILQNSAGEVFEKLPFQKPVKKFDSLADYITSVN